MLQSYNFISSETLISQVKQGLRSYFDSGSLNEILIPTYIYDCLRKLGVRAMEYNEDFITIEEFKGKLPNNFLSLKDAYLCNSNYEVNSPITTSLFEYYKKVNCSDCLEGCDTECEVFTHKYESVPSWVITKMTPTLLKVNFSCKKHCSDDCKGIFENSDNVINISKKSISTNFNSGTIYLQYWSLPQDEDGLMVPEIVEVEQYIINYLYFKLFEELYHVVTDESINIIERKLQFYRQTQMQKYEAALNVLKSQTKQQVRDSIINQRKRMVKYTIS